jgi:NADH-quinone oxidoreductase subunit L
VLVLADSFVLMFVGWEGVGVSSFLRIGFWYQTKANADAARKAFIVNRIGDVGFLLAMFLMVATFGTLNIAEVNAAAVGLAFGSGTLALIGLFLLVAATGKSAQLPLQVWLPDAMAGPTPVSALIHAATMVTAGVFLVCWVVYLATATYTIAPVRARLPLRPTTPPVLLIGLLMAWITLPSASRATLSSSSPME